MRILFFIVLQLILSLPGRTAPSDPSTAKTPVLTQNLKPSVPFQNPGVPAPAVAAMPNEYVRYGQILKPGGTPDHPVQLSLPTPLSAEINLPSPDDIERRIKLEQLASLSDAEIRAQLERWAPYSKMSLADQGRILVRLQEFRDFRHLLAQHKASDLGLSLTPKQMQQFETQFWNLRLAADQEMLKNFRPAYEARESKLSEQLYQEFSKMTPVPVLGGKK